MSNPHNLNIPGRYGQFSLANPSSLCIFGLWEETGAPRGNPRRHGTGLCNGRWLRKAQLLLVLLLVLLVLLLNLMVLLLLLLVLFLLLLVLFLLLLVLLL
eukprot:g30451.t1